ncbi:multidrug efflux SMR transporter [Enterococcus faecalis]|uniref:DMT family transporter n=1 Tax=Kurthia TaxID=1649 RepID=UPI0019FB60A6|nr:multidrug efflux SMR transporter [Kurthia sp. YJT4]EGO2530048.1 multidrug efflux SMR transporter [Enterococcus faecalis]EGO2530212.1 multidrug efflux SMR transporter [Enterococcus faecalis]EGO5149528.1 multidrug efflux SMR transporter [Enterococcus faecalis]EGO5149628.1 multidrug efflux SMR transporter [Enterococcus faecalis]EGO8070532.1 multidrug efflux SMR transporter [Enterococcus faecalis]
MNGYIALVIAIIAEVFGSSMLKSSEGFTNLFPSIGVVIGFGLAFYFLGISLKTLPLSLAYAIWAGAGTALTTLVGIIIWNDPFNALTFLGVALIIGGVVILNQKSSDDATSTSL